MNRSMTPHAADKANKTPGKPDPKETAQEAIHQVMPKDKAKKLTADIPAKGDSQTPLRAAKGDDDLMSQPPKTSMPDKAP